MSHSKIAKLIAEVSKDLMIDIPDVDKVTIMQEVRNLVKTKHPVPELMNSDSESEQETSSDVEFIGITKNDKKNTVSDVIELDSDEKTSDSRVSDTRAVIPVKVEDETVTSVSNEGYEDIADGNSGLCDKGQKVDVDENAVKLSKSNWRDVRRKFSRKNPWVTRRRKKKKPASHTGQTGKNTWQSYIKPTVSRNTLNKKKCLNLKDTLSSMQTDTNEDKLLVLKNLESFSGPDTRTVSKVLASLNIGSTVDNSSAAQSMKSESDMLPSTEEIIRKSMKKYPGTKLKDISVNLKDCITKDFQYHLKYLRADSDSSDSEIHEECHRSLFFKCGAGRHENIALWSNIPRPIQICPKVRENELNVNHLVGLSRQTAAQEKQKLELKLIGIDDLQSEYEDVNAVNAGKGFDPNIDHVLGSAAELICNSTEHVQPIDSWHSANRIRAGGNSKMQSVLDPSSKQLICDDLLSDVQIKNTKSEQPKACCREIANSPSSEYDVAMDTNSESQLVLDPVTGQFVFESILQKVKQEPRNSEDEETVSKSEESGISSKKTKTLTRSESQVGMESTGILSGGYDVAEDSLPSSSTVVSSSSICPGNAELIYSGVTSKGVLPIKQIEIAINKDIKSRRGVDDFDWNHLKTSLAERVSRIEKLMGTISADNKRGESQYALQKARAELNSVKEQTGLIENDSSLSVPSDEEASSDSNFSVSNLINNEDEEMVKAEERGIKRKRSGSTELSKRISLEGDSIDSKEYLSTYGVKEKHNETIAIESDEGDSDSLSDIDLEEVPIQRVTKYLRDVKFLAKFDMLIRRELYKSMLAPNAKNDEFDKTMPVIMGITNEANVCHVLERKMARLKLNLRKKWRNYVLTEKFGDKKVDLMNKSRVQARSLEYLRSRVYSKLRPCISKELPYEMLCRMILVSLGHILKEDKLTIIEMNRKEWGEILKEEKARRKKDLQAAEFVRLQLKEAERLRNVNLQETEMAKQKEARLAAQNSQMPLEVPKEKLGKGDMYEVPILPPSIITVETGQNRYGNPLIGTQFKESDLLGADEISFQTMNTEKTSTNPLVHGIMKHLFDEVNTAKIDSAVSGCSYENPLEKGSAKVRCKQNPKNPSAGLPNKYPLQRMPIRASSGRGYVNPLGKDMSKVRSKIHPENLIYPPSTGIQKRYPFIFFKLQQHVQKSLAKSAGNLLSDSARDDLAYRIATTYASEHSQHLQSIENAIDKSIENVLDKASSAQEDLTDFIIEQNIDDDEEEEDTVLTRVKQCTSPPLCPNSRQNQPKDQDLTETEISNVRIKQEPVEYITETSTTSPIPSITDFQYPLSAPVQYISRSALKLSGNAITTSVTAQSKHIVELKQDSTAQRNIGSIGHKATPTSLQGSILPEQKSQTVPVLFPSNTFVPQQSQPTSNVAVLLPQQEQLGSGTVTADISHGVSQTILCVGQSAVVQASPNIRQIQQQALLQPSAQRTILQPVTQPTVLQPTIISGLPVQQQILVPVVSPAISVSPVLVQQDPSLQTPATLAQMIGQPESAVNASSLQGSVPQQTQSKETQPLKPRVKRWRNPTPPPLVTSQSPTALTQVTTTSTRQLRPLATATPALHVAEYQGISSPSIPQIRPLGSASPSFAAVGSQLPPVQPNGIPAPQTEPASTLNSQFCKLPIPQMQLADFLAMQLRAQIEAANNIAENAASKSLNLPFMNNDQEIMAALNAPILKSIDSPLLAALNSTVIKALEGTATKPQNQNLPHTSSGENSVFSATSANFPQAESVAKDQIQNTKGQALSTTNCASTVVSTEPQNSVQTSSSANLIPSDATELPGSTLSISSSTFLADDSTSKESQNKDRLESDNISAAMNNDESSNWNEMGQKAKTSGPDSTEKKGLPHSRALEIAGCVDKGDGISAVHEPSAVEPGLPGFTLVKEKSNSDSPEAPPLAISHCPSDVAQKKSEKGQDMEDSLTSDSDSDALHISVAESSRNNPDSDVEGPSSEHNNIAAVEHIGPIMFKDSCEENITSDKHMDDSSSIPAEIRKEDDLSSSDTAAKSPAAVCTIVSYSSLATNDVVINADTHTDPPSDPASKVSSSADTVPSLRDLLFNKTKSSSPSVVPSLVNPVSSPALPLTPNASVSCASSSTRTALVNSLTKSNLLISQTSLPTSITSTAGTSTIPNLTELLSSDVQPVTSSTDQTSVPVLPVETNTLQNVSAHASIPSPGLGLNPSAISPGFIASPLDGAFRVTLPDETINKIIEDAINNAGATLTPKAQELVRMQLDKISVTNETPDVMQTRMTGDTTNPVVSAADNSTSGASDGEITDGNLTSSLTRRKNDPFFKLPSTGLRPIRTVAKDGKVSWSCTQCGKSFSRNFTFRRHAETHTNAKPWKCDICAKAFTDRRYLNKHMRWHTGQDLQYCARCGRAFTDELALSKHMRVHDTDKKFQCERCSKLFSDARTLQRHIMHVHDQKKTHQCELCKLSFVFKSHLDDHMKRHTGEKPHQCSICGKGFIQVGTRNRHERQHKGGLDGEPYKCYVCMNIFWFKDALRSHFLSMHPDIPIPDANKKLFAEVDQAAQHVTVSGEDKRLRVEHIPRERYSITSSEEDSSDPGPLYAPEFPALVPKRETSSPDRELEKEQLPSNTSVPADYFPDALSTGYVLVPESMESIPGTVRNLLAATVEPSYEHDKNKEQVVDVITDVDSKEHLRELVQQQEKRMAAEAAETTKKSESHSVVTDANMKVEAEPNQSAAEHFVQKSIEINRKTKEPSQKDERTGHVPVQIKTEPEDLDTPLFSNNELKGNAFYVKFPSADNLLKSISKSSESASAPGKAPGTIKATAEQNTTEPTFSHSNKQTRSLMKDRTDKIESLMELFRQRGVPKEEDVSVSDSSNSEIDSD